MVIAEDNAGDEVVRLGESVVPRYWYLPIRGVKFILL
jgi:hypothetical protein